MDRKTDRRKWKVLDSLSRLIITVQAITHRKNERGRVSPLFAFSKHCQQGRAFEGEPVASKLPDIKEKEKKKSLKCCKMAIILELKVYTMLKDKKKNINPSYGRSWKQTSRCVKKLKQQRVVGCCGCHLYQLIYMHEDFLIIFTVDSPVPLIFD